LRLKLDRVDCPYAKRGGDKRTYKRTAASASIARPENPKMITPPKADCWPGKKDLI